MLFQCILVWFELQKEKILLYYNNIKFKIMINLFH
jgi:hypothetical protein